MSKFDSAGFFSKSLSCKYSMGQKNGLHAFGYNSAESSLIWMKSGTMWAKCWGLAACDTRRSDSLRRSRILCVWWITHNFADFPSEKFTTFEQQRRSVKRWKLSEQNFDNFTIRGCFSTKKCKNCSKIFHLVTSGRHNSATMTDCRKFTAKLLKLTNFTVIINSSFSSWMYVPHKKGIYPNFWLRLMSDIA